MTPYEIKVFLHHATSPALYEHHGAPIYPETMERMVADGLFVKQRPPNDSMFEFILVPKGHALLAMLTSVPLPEVAFIDPRTGETIKSEFQ